MMGKFILASALACALAAPLAAQSQPGGSSETGTLITRPPAVYQGETTADARETVRQFGMCSLRRSPTLSEQLLDVPVDTPQFTKLLNRIAADECLSYGELRIPFQLLRGAIFEAFYSRRFGRDFRADLKSVPSFNYTAGYARPLSEDAANTISLAIVADCVVRTDPAPARQMIAARPGSPSEIEAIGLIAAKLPGCVPPKQKLRFSRSVIRAATAEALYRLSTMARSAGGVAK